MLMCNVLSFKISDHFPQTVTEHIRFLVFTARRYASAVLGVVILSICPSVCPSVWHTRALWLIQRTYRRYFDTTWKGTPSSFLPPNSGWWATSPSTWNGRSNDPPFKNRSRRQISTCNVSTVRASEKSSIMTNRKSYTGFPTSHQPRFYAAPNFLKMGSNTWIRRLSYNFDNKGRDVCCKVKLSAAKL